VVGPSWGEDGHESQLDSDVSDGVRLIEDGDLLVNKEEGTYEACGANEGSRVGFRPRVA